MLYEFQTAITNRLNGSTLLTNAGVVVLSEDLAEFQNKFDLAVAETGAMVIIQQPDFENTEGGGELAPALINLSVGIKIGEFPATWRDVADTRPHCTAIVDEVIGRLQGFKIAGFRALIVERGAMLRQEDAQICVLTVKSNRVIDATTL